MVHLVEDFANASLQRGLHFLCQSIAPNNNIVDSYQTTIMRRIHFQRRLEEPAPC